MGGSFNSGDLLGGGIGRCALAVCVVAMVALVRPGTGISTSLGLLDARGPALARALAARGLHPREPRTSDGQLRPLGSIAELLAWLDMGPLLMDGARWFGEGHWFVGIGYDAGGVYIRDSSGWDTRYLSGRG